MLEAMAADFALFDRFQSSFRNIRRLGPLRMPSQRSYLYSGELAEWIGPRGELALQNYSALVKRGRRQDKEKVGLINQAL